MSKCPEFFYGNCPIRKQENKELIDKFCKDLKNLEEYDSELDAADMRFLREKWEAKKSEN